MQCSNKAGTAVLEGKRDGHIVGDFAGRPQERHDAPDYNFHRLHVADPLKLSPLTIGFVNAHATIRKLSISAQTAVRAVFVKLQLNITMKEHRCQMLSS